MHHIASCRKDFTALYSSDTTGEKSNLIKFDPFMYSSQFVFLKVVTNN